MLLSPFTQFEISYINYGLPQLTYISTLWYIPLAEYFSLLYEGNNFNRLVENLDPYSADKWDLLLDKEAGFYDKYFSNKVAKSDISPYWVALGLFKPYQYTSDKIVQLTSKFSGTNIQLILFLGLSLIILLQLMGTKVLKIKPEYWQVVVENFYTFLLNLIIAQAGHKSLRFFSGIYTIFYFILIFNLLGLLPFGFTVTGHIILTFTLAISFFIAWTIIAFKTLGLSFFRIFLPRNIPKALAPLLVVIEILSFSIRPISLSIRLFANMLAGHILLFIISTAVLVMSSLTILIGFIPFLFVIIFFILELGIAFLQAYVFTILLAIYLRDALYVH